MDEKKNYPEHIPTPELIEIKNDIDRERRNLDNEKYKIDSENINYNQRSDRLKNDILEFTNEVITSIDSEIVKINDKFSSIIDTLHNAQSEINELSWVPKAIDFLNTKLVRYIITSIDQFVPLSGESFYEFVCSNLLNKISDNQKAKEQIKERLWKRCLSINILKGRTKEIESLFKSDYAKRLDSKMHTLVKYTIGMPVNNEELTEIYGNDILHPGCIQSQIESTSLSIQSDDFIEKHTISRLMNGIVLSQEERELIQSAYGDFNPVEYMLPQKIRKKFESILA